MRATDPLVRKNVGKAQQAASDLAQCQPETRNNRSSTEAMGDRQLSYIDVATLTPFAILVVLKDLTI